MKRIINTEIHGNKCSIEYTTEKGVLIVSFTDEKTEYTISPIKNSEYLVMIQTEGASEGPMTSVPWCDPVDTWLSEGRLSIYDEKQMDDNTVFLATLMYGELLKLNRDLRIAKSDTEFVNALGI